MQDARHWALQPSMPAAALFQYPGIPPLIAQLLYNRGVKDGDAAVAFLADTAGRTADPLLMTGMREAVTRLSLAAERGETVAIYGDFDVDGITSSALLAEAFAAAGISAVPYLPSRAEGYGLTSQALRGLAEQGIRLVVTADCGINSVREIEGAKQVGLDVLVTDHHHIDGPLPAAVAVINPRQEGCAYPFKDLAAVGIAWKLAEAVLRRLPAPAGTAGATLSGALDLVALGTVADVVPLLGENRVFVREGLAALNGTGRLGLKELMTSAGLRAGRLNAATIGYALAPRLNAAGRLADATAAYRLLRTDSAAEAKTLAAELESANLQRQRLTSEALQQARAQIATGQSLPKLLAVAREDFASGIVGLVAGRLVEEFHRPALIIERGEQESRGSGRSIEGFSIVEALANCRDLLTRFGGHAFAAGFTVPTANLPNLLRRLLDLADEQLDIGLLRPRLVVDAELPLPSISWDLYNQLVRLAPFGNGNPQPLFLARGVHVMSSRRVGRDLPGHLKLQLHDGQRPWQGIGFRMGETAARVAPQIDIVYTVERNEWEGRESLELHLRDWRPAIN